MEDLPTELLALITFHLPAHEDLLRLSRASRRVNSVVFEHSEEAWRKQYFSSGFPAPQPPRPPARIVWREAFKDKFMQCAQKARVERKVRFIQLYSQQQTFQRELSKIQDESMKERARQKQALNDIQSLKRAQQAGAASGAWAPSSVQQSWDRIVSAAPVDIPGRLLQLENDVKACKLTLEVLGNSKTAKRRQLQLVQQQLQAMQA